MSDGEMIPAYPSSDLVEREVMLIVTYSALSRTWLGQRAAGDVGVGVKRV